MHAFLMKIFPVISTKGGPLRVMYFGLGMVQLVECQSFNRCARGVVDYRGRVYGVDGSLQGSGVASKFNV